MKEDVCQFVAVCDVCIKNKSSNLPPAGSTRNRNYQFRLPKPLSAGVRRHGRQHVYSPLDPSEPASSRLIRVMVSTRDIP